MDAAPPRGSHQDALLRLDLRRDDYAHHAGNFAGIDLGQGLRPIADFAVQPSATLSAQSFAGGDLLADFVPAASGLHEAAPLPEPWSVIEADVGPATHAAAATAAPEPEPQAVEPAPVAFLASPAGLPHPAADLWLPGDDLSAAGPPVEHATMDPVPDRHATG